jgi:hypothetical protein
MLEIPEFVGCSTDISGCGRKGYARSKMLDGRDADKVNRELGAAG